ncbi:MAG TPA: ParB/RepB/Spo0J family partition protein [Pyrinomonadaceae bacterium]|nr:ParB/RepB/Spo0J family partition protein [Pyrinomonadaceae bacterium]
MTRKALGRGLSALLSADQPAPLEETSEIPVDLIDPSPVQPRSYFDDRSLQELAMSIRENGIVQPVLVRPNGIRFELVAGERRWRAAQVAGLTQIPVVIRDIPSDKVLELALIENIQREDLNAIEEARAYKNLIETVGLTQESLAQRVGRDRSYITNHIRLLRLADDLQQFVQEGRLSAGHARTLLGVDDVAIQRRVARKIMEKGLSVRETERVIQQFASGARTSSKSRAAGSVDPNLKAAETKLRRKLGTRVNIIPSSSRPGGKIEIEYYDDRDLDRFYGLLMGGMAASAGEV